MLLLKGDFVTLKQFRRSTGVMAFDIFTIGKLQYMNMCVNI